MRVRRIFGSIPSQANLTSLGSGTRNSSAAGLPKESADRVEQEERNEEEEVGKEGPQCS